MPFGYLLEAEYEHGYILKESFFDVNPFGEGNTFTAILNDDAEKAGHGRMVRFSLIPMTSKGRRYDVDWQKLWNADNPRPIYYRKMSHTLNLDTNETSGQQCLSHHFGFQYNDKEGNNVQEVVECS